MQKKQKKGQSSGIDRGIATFQKQKTVAEGFDTEMPQYRLAELQILANAHAAKEEWEELVKIGRLTDDQISDEDREVAKVWRLRVLISGLNPTQKTWTYDLSTEVRRELTEALQQLANLFHPLHALPEFDQYLTTRGWSFDDNLQVYQHLISACMEVSNADWIRMLRARALRLLNRDDSEEERSSLEDEKVAALPDIYAALSEAYTLAETSGSLDEEGIFLAKILKLELDMMMAEPWDYGHVTDALLRFPSPGTHELANFPRNDPRGSSYQHLTPLAWAFMWELENTHSIGLADLTTRYADKFECDGCEGLRLVALSLASDSSKSDEILSDAIETLMLFANDSPEWFGESLTLMSPRGPREIHIGATPLQMKSVGDLLIRLLESAPDSYSRRDELLCVYRVFDASSQYASFDDDEEADEEMLGLAWPCQQSIAFQFAAASTVHGATARILLLVDALRRCAESGVPPPYNYYPGDIADADIEASKASRVLDAVQQLAVVRDLMHEKSRMLWREVVGDIFAALSRIEGEPRHRTLELARTFSEDLLAKGESFRLAYLEQVVGSPNDALSYYLMNIEASQQPSEAVLNNAKLLWHKSESIENLPSFVKNLEGAVKKSIRPDVVRKLLVDAQGRLDINTKQIQFEQTAINRWPTLTAPARKVLGVFSTIQRYNSFRELGEYAGMDEVWAQRHYNKLVETGMLLVSEKGFRINPHIAPLLARESQHAVVGRIVRSQGTSAVKQVFNSQREFTIYQVMVQLCPNHLVFPNFSLQSIMSYERMKELVSDDDFGYYLRASVDIVVVSSTTYLPMLAIEVDSVWHDTERQQKNDDKKDRLFSSAGVPFMRLRPVGSPSENTVRAEVTEHVAQLVRTLRADLPGFEQARGLLEELSGISAEPAAK